MRFKPPYLLSEFTFKASRSGGKGGQNVNKVSSKVQVSFAIPGSQLLTDEEKAMLMEKLNGQLTQEGELQVTCQADSQLANKEIALRKLYHKLNACFVVKKKRKPTKPTKSSIEKRLGSKKRNAEIKRSRNTIPPEHS